MLLTDTYVESLKDVAFNRSDAAVLEPGVGNYLIKEFNIPNVKIINEFNAKDLGVEYAFHFGVNKTNAILVSILNKAMKSLTADEIEDINKKWLTIETVTDYSLVWEILAVVFFIMILFGYYNSKLKQLVNEKTKALQSLLDSFDKNVIASSTDIKGRITYASDALCEISGYTKDELIGKPHNIIRHPDMSHEAFEELWDTIKAGKIWRGEVKNLKKDGGFYWVDAVITPQYDLNNRLIGYSSVRHDITSKKEVEALSESLEAKVEERTAALKQNTNLMINVAQNANLGFWNFNPQIWDFYVNDVFVDMLGYDTKEVLKDGYENEMLKPFKEGFAFWKSLIHPDDAEHAYKEITAHINGETSLYNVTSRMRKADGSWMWSTAIGRISRYDKSGKPIKFDGVNMDIDEIKNAQEQVAQNRLFLDTLLDSQEQIVITTDGKTLISANKKFLEFFDLNNIEEFKKDYSCICDKFIIDDTNSFLQKRMGDQSWIEYLISNNHLIHKAVINKNGQNKIFSVSAAVMPIENKKVMSAVFTDITELEKIREEIEAIHKHTTESIEYASLIQHALIPPNNTFKKYFDEYFTIWSPKDIVGGDIYLFEELKSEKECLLMVIDCTGHGVPGAFVTMLVKAIERQITAKINHGNEIVSPAKILEIFNKSMKHLLKQENDESVSNAGFDGAIFYYNKEEKIIKYAGAQIPLFYIENDELKIIKGSRHSVGYKKSDADFKFKEHTIEVREGMKFYITTDGYLDQNGGKKSFSLGKKRFGDMLMKNSDKTFSTQKRILINALKDYQGEEERNDDITIVGIKI